MDRQHSDPVTGPRPGSRSGSRSVASAVLAASVALAAPALAVDADADDQVAPAPAIEAVTPERAFDSRVPDGPTAGNLVADGQWFGLRLAGLHGVPADAAAVVINVTAVEPLGPGFVTVSPGSLDVYDGGAPTTSNLNVGGAGETVANAAIIPLGGPTPPNDRDFDFRGSVLVYTSVASHLLVDVLGYVPAGADFESVDLQRPLDTRSLGGPAQPDTWIDVDVAAPDDAALVVVNLTLVEAAAPGFVTVFPAGGTPPTTSNLNVETAGQTRAALAIVPIGAEGSISVVSDVEGHLLVDVLGFLGADSGFEGLEPSDRILDTRPDRAAALGTTVVPVTGSVPADATVVVVNVTAVEAAEAGFVTVWPTGLDQPDASNLNYDAGGTISNTVLVPVGTDGSISVFTQSGIALLVDVIGWA